MNTRKLKKCFLILWIILNITKYAELKLSFNGFNYTRKNSKNFAMTHTKI